MAWIVALSFGGKVAIGIAVSIFPTIIVAVYLFNRHFNPEDKPLDDPFMDNDASLRNRRALFGRSFVRYLAWAYREAKKAEKKIGDD